ncbi:MAG TPA: hypothetical protein VFS50_10585, partial [Meiothermus sp.]|nr:hypothetical protein [Meiothermus sp.]
AFAGSEKAPTATRQPPVAGAGLGVGVAEGLGLAGVGWVAAGAGVGVGVSLGAFGSTGMTWTGGLAVVGVWEGVCEAGGEVWVGVS